MPETERAWLDVARDKTVRQVERLVSGREPGSLPTDAPKAELRRHVLRFEVSGSTLATFREAIAKIRRETGESLDDDALLALLARRVLEGPTGAGRASYQIALSVCEACGGGAQRAQGEFVPVSAEVVAMAECDAQRVPTTAGLADRIEQSAHVGPARASQTIPPALRRAVLQRDAGCCVFPGCRNAVFVDVHHLHPRNEGGRHELDNLITLCTAHHTRVHDGTVVIEGSPKRGLRFHHADRSRYGTLLPNGAAIATRTKAFGALRALGFGEREVRVALAGTQVGDESQVDVLIRQGLLTLTAGRRAPSRREV